eukprot:4285095-Prymnesium_polylepis.1
MLKKTTGFIFGLRPGVRAARWTLFVLEGCHSRSPEPHRLVAIVFFARYCATTMPIGSAVAEVVTDSTLVAHLSLAIVRCAVRRRAAANFGSVKTRQDGRTVSRVGLHYWSPDSDG